MSVLYAVRRWLTDERGQDLVEYGLIVCLIAVVCMATVMATGTSVNGYWTTISAAVAAIPGA